jgi:hypothetical protein
MIKSLWGEYDGDSQNDWEKQSSVKMNKRRMESSSFFIIKILNRPTNINSKFR